MLRPIRRCATLGELAFPRGIPPLAQDGSREGRAPRPPRRSAGVSGRSPIPRRTSRGREPLEAERESSLRNPGRSRDEHRRRQPDYRWERLPAIGLEVVLSATSRTGDGTPRAGAGPGDITRDASASRARAFMITLSIPPHQLLSSSFFGFFIFVVYRSYHYTYDITVL